MVPFGQTGLQYIAKISPVAQMACSFQTQLILQHEEGTPFEEALIGKCHGNCMEEGGDTCALPLKYLSPRTSSEFRLHSIPRSWSQTWYRICWSCFIMCSTNSTMRACAYYCRRLRQLSHKNWRNTQLRPRIHQYNQSMAPMRKLQLQKSRIHNPCRTQSAKYKKYGIL